MKKTNIKTIIMIAAVLLFSVFPALRYCQASILCRQIRAGEEIHTNFSNGVTAPLFFVPFEPFLDSEIVHIPLKEACIYRNIQAVEVLLKNGANPNFFFEGRWSPLETLLRSTRGGLIDEKCFEIIKMLVEAGADVTLHGAKEEPVCQLSGIMIHSEDPLREEILVYLLENGGANPHSCQEVFYDMIRGGSPKLVRYLIETYGVDLNATTYKGQTSLILAVAYSERSATPEMIELLLEKGADRTLRDDHGKTAYDYAEEAEYEALLPLLQP